MTLILVYPPGGHFNAISTHVAVFLAACAAIPFCGIYWHICLTYWKRLVSVGGFTLHERPPAVSSGGSLTRCLRGVLGDAAAPSGVWGGASLGSQAHFKQEIA